MAVRNAAAFLGETIASLRAQTGTGLEFVVLDDGSSDATPRLLADWAACDDRVRIETVAGGSGSLPAALNRGLALCRAPLVARADGDDLYHPERLARQRARFAADPALDALSCGFHRIDEAGVRIGTATVLSGPELIRFTALFQNALLHPGAMMRKAVLERIGGYDTTYWTAQDSDLFARMLAAGARIDNVAEPLVSYRVHDSSRMKTRGAEGRALSLTVPARMQAAYLGGLPEDHDVAATVALYQGRQRVPIDAAGRGLSGLERIDAAATGREPPEVLAHFRDTVAASLHRQAGWTSRRRLLQRLKLRRAARRWQGKASHDA